MTETVRKWRQKHRKCVYCIHLDTSEDLSLCASITAWWCRAKKKTITQDAAYRWRPFCGCYEQPEGSGSE